MKSIAKALAFTVLVLAAVATTGAVSFCWTVVAVLTLFSLLYEEEA